MHTTQVRELDAVAADEVRRWKQCFGDARQLGYLTTDLMKAIEFFVDGARIGPWFVAANRYLRGVDYRGTVMDVKLSTAHANSGGLQIELIEPDPDQVSIYSEWLARDGNPKRALVQHMAWWVPDYAEACRLAEARGYARVQHGSSAQGGFAYFQHAALPEFNFEVTEVTPDRTAKYQRIAAAADGWDGTAPVRIL